MFLSSLYNVFGFLSLIANLVKLGSRSSRVVNPKDVPNIYGSESPCIFLVMTLQPEILPNLQLSS